MSQINAFPIATRTVDFQKIIDAEGFSQDAEAARDQAASSADLAQANANDAKVYASVGDLPAVTASDNGTWARVLVDSGVQAWLVVAGAWAFQAWLEVYDFSSIADMRSHASDYAHGDVARVKSDGNYIKDNGQFWRKTPSLSLVDRVMNSGKITGLYLRDRSGDLAVGVSFGGQPAGAIVEYRFEKDTNGWWRDNGAISGFAETFVGEFAPNKGAGNTMLGGVANANAYTETEGDSFTATFTGNDLNFRSFTDDRGGLWRFWIDGEPYDVSVYRASSGIIEQSVATGLGGGSHNLVMEFIGDDPNNVPSSGAGTARGWIYWADISGGGSYPDDKRALNISREWRVGELSYSTTTREIISPNSINGFAFLVKEPGSSNPFSWVPAHTANSIVDGSVEVAVFADGAEIDPNTYSGKQQIKTFEIVQMFDFTQEQETTALGRLVTRYRIDETGRYTIEYKVTAHTDFEVGIWYPAQVAVGKTNMTEVVLNNGFRFDLSTLGADDAQGLDVPMATSAAFVGLFASNLQQATAIDVDLDGARLADLTPDPSTKRHLLTSRDSDDLYKLYWRASVGDMTMSAGETISMKMIIGCVLGARGPSDYSVGGDHSLI